MNIEENIEKLKKRSALINGVNIDFQHVQILTPQVLNSVDQNTQEYKDLCKTFYSLCDSVEEGLKQIKQLIPNSVE